MNNYRDGFFSSELDLSENEEPAFEVFKQELLNELRPEGFVEDLLSDRIATTFWRLRRVAQVEAGLIHFKPLEFFMKNREVAADLTRYERQVEMGLFDALNELRTIQGSRGIKGKVEGRIPPGDRRIKLTKEGIDLDATLAEFERDLVLQALELSDGVKLRAAELLGIKAESFRYRFDKYTDR